MKRNFGFSKHYLDQFQIKQSRSIYCRDSIPVFDDGEGTDYFRCEVPITKKGDKIEEGKLYKTRWIDSVLLKSMHLNTKYVQHYWKIIAVDQEFNEELDYLCVDDFTQLIHNESKFSDNQL